MGSSKQILRPEALAFYDVSRSVKSWGRQGVVFGGVFGFALGAAFVAIPFTSDVLTFGVIGTLVVAAVEGAVIAGAFAVCIAAFCGKGELYSRAARSGRVIVPVLSSSQAETVLVEASTQSALNARQWISTVDARSLSEWNMRH
ncbi:MAG: hypothetical protein P4L57_11705 [Rhizomicrobium sp.]|nr:hypothetical protein [Rhizomicrobium sp.]